MFSLCGWCLGPVDGLWPFCGLLGFHNGTIYSKRHEPSFSLAHTDKRCQTSCKHQHPAPSTFINVQRAHFSPTSTILKHLQCPRNILTFSVVQQCLMYVCVYWKIVSWTFSNISIRQKRLPIQLSLSVLLNPDPSNINTLVS